MSFAPRRPYVLLLPACLDLLLLSQPGPTYLRFLCVARAAVLASLTFAPRWRKRTLALVVPLASVLACVWESCKSTLYKYPDSGEGGGTDGGSGGGEWDEWYGPEASATYLAETCVLALGEILLYTLLLRLTPRFPPPRGPVSRPPLSPQTPSPPPPRGFLFGSLRSAAALRKPSPLGPGRLPFADPAPSALGATLGSDLASSHASSASLTSDASDDSLGTSPSPGAGPSPPLSRHSRSRSPQQRVVSGESSGSASGARKERLALQERAHLESDERSDLLGPLRVSPHAKLLDLPPHTTVDLEAGPDEDDGYDSSNSESSIIDMPRRRVARLDAESIGEVAENASASVISVVAGIGGIVRRSASRSLLGTSPGYGTFD